MATDQEVQRTFDLLLERAANYRAVLTTMDNPVGDVADRNAFSREHNRISDENGRTTSQAQIYAIEVLARGIDLRRAGHLADGEPEPDLANTYAERAALMAREADAVRRSLDVLAPSETDVRRELLNLVHAVTASQSDSSDEDNSHGEGANASLLSQVGRFFDEHRSNQLIEAAAFQKSATELGANYLAIQNSIENLIVAEATELRGDELAQPVDWNDYSRHYLARATGLDREISGRPEDPTLIRFNRFQAPHIDQRAVARAEPLSDEESQPQAKRSRLAPMSQDHDNRLAELRRHIPDFQRLGSISSDDEDDNSIGDEPSLPATQPESHDPENRASCFDDNLHDRDRQVPHGF